jgi:hypothetical protein
VEGFPVHEFKRYVEEQNRKYHLREITLNKTRYPSSDIVFMAHTPDQLSQTLKEFVSSTKRYGMNFGINSTQRTGIYEYKKLRELPALDHLDEKVMKKYYLAFNKIFFLGVLKNMAVLEIHGAFPGRAGDCASHDGGSRDVPPNTAHLIRLHPDRDNHDSSEEFLKSYLGTLLHETLHAFLSSYSCHCSKECKDKYKSRVGSHGHVWQESAHAIEKATAHLLNKTLSLHRQPSVFVEWHSTGSAPLETEIDVAAWGMKYSEVLLDFVRRQKQG